MRQQYGIELKAETEANKSIETQLKQEKRAERNKIRILVLGLLFCPTWANVKQGRETLVNQPLSSK